MKISDIKLDGFRNFSAVSTDFDDSVNVIVGDNAQGKTNLLESIFYVTTGKSFRARSDKELINFNGDSAYICANAVRDDRDVKIEIKLRRGLKKQLILNNVKLKTIAELSGNLAAVMFSPDDLYMIKDGANERRRLMNICISQLRPRYAAMLIEFAKTYENKTRILRDYEEKPSLLSMLDEYNYRLCQLSAELIYYRAHFVEKLKAAAEKIHYDFSGGKEVLSMTYKTVKTVPDPKSRPSEILPYLLEHQALHKRAELESGLCLSGAHKDDIDIEINGKSAKNFASQGQTRTAALSIKLAEREVHYGDRGEYPILLLDDVLSELDPSRQNFVLNKIAGGQMFITCCEDSQIEKKIGGRILRVKKGEIF